MKEWNKIASERLIEIQEESGMDKKTFAIYFGMAPSTFNRYQSGNIKEMPRPLAFKLCDKYNINPNWILGYEYAEKYGVESAGTEYKRILVKNTGDTISVQSKIDMAYVYGNEPCGRIQPCDLLLVVKKESIKNNDVVFFSFEDELIVGEYKVYGDVIVFRNDKKEYTNNVEILGVVDMVQFKVR